MKKPITKSQVKQSISFANALYAKAPDAEVLDIAATERSKSKYSTEEHDNQCAVIKWFDSKYPEYRGRLYAIPNGGNRGLYEAARLKKEGVRKGVFDLGLDIARRGYHGLKLEMKSIDGRVSPDQNGWYTFYSEQDYAAFICRSAEEAINKLDWYLLFPIG